MRFTSHTEAGDPTHPNEDWVACSSDLAVVLDGVSTRTDTGCSHGITWFTEHLGSTIVALAADPDHDLQTVLARAIDTVARLHSTCDLTHPSTPAAAVAILRSTASQLEYLVLADITIALDTNGTVRTVIDDRVSATATAQREAANHAPLGTPEKHHALLAMKLAELAVRNQPGGYWVAAANPDAARHAITGATPLANLHRAAALTDGAARLVDTYHSHTWPQLLDQLETHGPAHLIKQTRTIEATDRHGTRWPRNKPSDDATIVLVST